MKYYEVELDIHFSKTVRVQASNADAAAHLAEAMLLQTDALELYDEDMTGLISSATEVGGNGHEADCPICADGSGRCCDLFPENCEECADSDPVEDTTEDEWRKKFLNMMGSLVAANDALVCTMITALDLSKEMDNEQT